MGSVADGAAKEAFEVAAARGEVQPEGGGDLSILWCHLISHERKLSLSCIAIQMILR